MASPGKGNDDAPLQSEQRTSYFTTSICPGSRGPCRRRSPSPAWTCLLKDSRNGVRIKFSGCEADAKTSNTGVKWQKPRNNRAPARGRLTGVLRFSVLFGEVVGGQRNLSNWLTGERSPNGDAGHTAVAVILGTVGYP